MMIGQWIKGQPFSDPGNPKNWMFLHDVDSVFAGILHPYPNGSR